MKKKILEGDITDNQYGWIIHFYPWLNRDDISNFTKQEAYDFIKNKKKPGFVCCQWYLYEDNKGNYFIDKTYRKTFDDLCEEIRGLGRIIRSRLYANKRILLEKYNNIEIGDSNDE